LSEATRPPRVADLGIPSEVLSPVDLQALVPLPPPYDDVDARTIWKELSPERRTQVDASLDGVSALSLARPADASDEKRQLEALAAGLVRLLGRADNWTFLQPLLLSLEQCTHCQTCADACPLYVGSGGNEVYRPTYRSDVLRRLLARHGPGGHPIRAALAGRVELNWTTLARLAELAYRCTLCRRCMQACPIGVDNGLIARELRKLYSQELGLAPSDLHARGSELQLTVGASTGMSPAALKDAVEFIDEETSERVGFRVTTPWDREGADVLLLHNAGEFLSWPENPGAFAVIMQQAGISWTLSSELVGYDAVNYGVWYDDAQFARVAVRQAEVAHRLKVRKIVIAECGHAHKALAVVAERILGPDAVPRESFAPFLASIVKSGALRLDPARNDFPVTLHDPCNLARGLGIVEAPRRVLRAVAPRFREMTPHGVDNYCCGGGSGFAIMSPNNFGAWRTLVAGRMKFRQVLEAFADEPGPDVPKYICAPCSNCKGQFRELLRAYSAWERSRIAYGGLVELVVNAMADVRPGYLDWEPH
jgi:Fe-S oxidoreductase